MIKTINWQGIEIEITYIESYSKSYERIYGYPLIHIELRAKERLPVTETGYRSYFSPAPLLSDFKTPEDFVRAWLDQEAERPEWKQYKEKSKQLALF